jgi:hypothetical protein
MRTISCIILPVDGSNRVHILGCNIWYSKEVGQFTWYNDGLQAEWSGFDSWQRQERIFHSTALRSALGSTQAPIQWTLELLP